MPATELEPQPIMSSAYLKQAASITPESCTPLPHIPPAAEPTCLSLPRAPSFQPAVTYFFHPPPYIMLIPTPTSPPVLYTRVQTQHRKPPPKKAREYNPTQVYPTSPLSQASSPTTASPKSSPMAVSPSTHDIQLERVRCLLQAAKILSPVKTTRDVEVPQLVSKLLAVQEQGETSGQRVLKRKWDDDLDDDDDEEGCW
ncbi:hypothetical protein HDU99_002869, partial [Rhizoclosmatium hyalinum]